MGESGIGGTSLVICQIALLVAHYGFNVALPIWVLWSPLTLILVIIFIPLIVILGVVLYEWGQKK